MREIDIERLDVRLKGVRGETAIAAADRLGIAIAERLDRQYPASVDGTDDGPRPIDAGRIAVPRGCGPDELRSAIAARVAAAIARGGRGR